MTGLTDRLDAIQARLDAATPGPWEWSKEEDVWGDCGPNLETVKRGPVYSDGSQGADEVVIGSWGHDANGISVDPGDAEFIANTPPDVAFLLDLARKQQAAIEAVYLWAGKSKSANYHQAQADVLRVIRNALEDRT